MESGRRSMLVLDIDDSSFLGWAGTVDEVPTCVVPAVVLTDEPARAQTAAAMRHMGAGCGTCTVACPVMLLRVAV